MFGSLVIVFPTSHKGRELVLRHESKAYTFDSSTLLSLPDMSKSVAFVAFFSDSDHEILPVTSGHRVTITYNLYFAPPGSIAHQLRAPPDGLGLLQPAGANTLQVTQALKDLLDATFRQDLFVVLGFGLRHQYPLPKTWSEKEELNPHEQLEKWLKGSDAALFAACHELHLNPVLRLVYYDDEPYDSTFANQHGVLTDHVVDLDAEPEELLQRGMRKWSGGVNVVFDMLGEHQDPDRWRHYELSYAGLYTSEGGEPRTVSLVTQTTCWNPIRSSYIAYGNEHRLELMYAYVCLLVGVGPSGDRGYVKDDPEWWKPRKGIHNGWW